MYTEINFGAVLRKDVPKEVIETIWALVHDGGYIKANHPFFDTPRYSMVMHGRSHYFLSDNGVPPIFVYNAISERYTLIFRANLKNYDNEIALFLDWIKPYLHSGCGMRDYYAVVCYEEDNEPTIYYLN